MQTRHIQACDRVGCRSLGTHPQPTGDEAPLILRQHHFPCHDRSGRSAVVLATTKKYRVKVCRVDVKHM